MLNSLSQTLLKITAPGVPDFYQGSELWDLRLVDPDNRGTVDFARRVELLRELTEKAAGDRTLNAKDLVENWADGRIKLYVIWKTLGLRQQLTELFTGGTYLPAQVSGERPENVTAFFRVSQKHSTLTIAPKWLAGSALHRDWNASAQFWGDTSIMLPAGASRAWRNVFMDEWMDTQSPDHDRIRMADALRHFPVALLSSAATD
jgi:(1->4)-alpha-D-glucan 1-alpha-D-glucosylmutase